jgi:hypothetical protein
MHVADFTPECKLSEGRLARVIRHSCGDIKGWSRLPSIVEQDKSRARQDKNARREAICARHATLTGKNIDAEPDQKD